MIITISGLAGTGTSSTAKELASKLGYEFQSSGNIFRGLAKEMNITLNELEEMSRTDPKYDLELDKRVRVYADEHLNSVIDSRLAWYFVPESFKVKLKCDDAVRLRRISEREKISLEQAKQETVKRELAIRDRYSKYYNISNFDIDSNFDLVINTTNTNLQDVVSMIEQEVKQIKLKN